MLIQEVIRAAIPSATDEECEWVLWERTPYPFGKLTAKDIYKAASRVRRAGANGVRLCDYCDNAANQGCICDRCRESLQRAMDAHPNR